MADNNNGNKEQKCLFCGKPKSSGKRFIGGGGAIICSDCIKSSNDILNRLEQAEVKHVIKPVPKPKDINMYINSPGGIVTAGLAVYDTMQYIKSPITTICMGMAMSFGAVLLAAGSKGKRYALQHSRIMIHQPLIYGGGLSGQVTDINVETKELLLTKNKLADILALHTGQTREKIIADTERNCYMSAQEAKEYGLIDEIIIPGKK